MFAIFKNKPVNKLLYFVHNLKPRPNCGIKSPHYNWQMRMRMPLTKTKNTPDGVINSHVNLLFLWCSQILDCSTICETRNAVTVKQSMIMDSIFRLYRRYFWNLFLWNSCRSRWQEPHSRDYGQVFERKKRKSFENQLSKDRNNWSSDVEKGKPYRIWRI